jgi:succinate dehydrogenase/fumarate reductase flavoprotein subunit
VKRLAPLRAAGKDIPALRCGVLVIGSGAAALAAADRLTAFAAAGDGSSIAADTLIATEALLGGASYNSGSDKQTYYRLSMTEREGDSPREMAKALWEGGAVHGDIALAEAVGSAEAFLHLASIGVPFPMNASGGYVGYKTDHDPRRRGSSIGPYTSKAMVERLLAEVRARGTPILDRRQAVALVARPPRAGAAGGAQSRGRVFGALFVDEARLDDDDCGLELIIADAVVFAVGGPGGLYGASVYPEGQAGAIGLAIEIGAACVNLTESQFGLASTGFRWNVSGTYQQAVPRYLSIGPGGDEEEFLTPFFQSAGERDTAVFLKGYQWPFDPRKAADRGSSLIDLLVHRERLVRGRRVFLDFALNPSSWDPASLAPEARSYLERSGALGGSPYDRLAAMNPLAAEHYLRHGTDLRRERLEIAVSAQHNNGGLAADQWWESVNVDRLFPVGEVCGSHGVYRPGGAALNSGQVGAARVARKIVGAYSRSDLAEADWRDAACERAVLILGQLGRGSEGESLDAYAEEFRSRMDSGGGIIRRSLEARGAAEAALAQVRRFGEVALPSRSRVPDYFRIRQLVLAHAAYLEAIASYAEAGGGSRGSALVAGAGGAVLHPGLGSDWNSLAGKPELLEALQELRYAGGAFSAAWTARRPIPEGEDWFEDAWRAFREGRIYEGRRE